MILTVTLNAAIDKRYVVENLSLIHILSEQPMVSMQAHRFLTLSASARSVRW